MLSHSLVGCRDGMGWDEWDSVCFTPRMPGSPSQALSPRFLAGPAPGEPRAHEKGCGAGREQPGKEGNIPLVFTVMAKQKQIAGLRAGDGIIRGFHGGAASSEMCGTSGRRDETLAGKTESKINE